MGYNKSIHTQTNIKKETPGKFHKNRLVIEFENLEARAFQSELKKMKDPVIIDIRSPDGFAKGSIRNAVNVSYGSDRRGEAKDDPTAKRSDSATVSN